VVSDKKSAMGFLAQKQNIDPRAVLVISPIHRIEHHTHSTLVICSRVLKVLKVLKGPAIILVGVLEGCIQIRIRDTMDSIELFFFFT